MTPVLFFNMMKTRNFAHLHSHTEYSLLDGSNKISNYIRRVKELGMESAAITDHGVMYGAIEFYKCAKESGIHPVIGCEVYIAPDSMYEKNSHNNRYYHLVLLAENNTGYQNLLKLVSMGFKEGFYYRPRVDFKALSACHEGIIALSGCLAGEVPKKLSQGNYKAACDTALQYQQLFGKENYYLELQDHGIPLQKDINKALIRMSQELAIPLVATNDIHYTLEEDAEAHDVLLCIQTKKLVSDKDRLRYEKGQYYVKSKEEMEALFPEIPEAIENTGKIAMRCQVDFSFNNYKLPQFYPPEGFDSWEYLKHLCRQGLKERYPDSFKEKQERLDYELNTICAMGFVDYFLITWDFIKFAKSNDIMVGPGRGSAAGSLVAYCLGITEVDPLKYQLLFERFLNPQRITMPDIDIDFCYERRQEVIDYVISKYGRENVAQIITFGTLAAKGVIRDVGRALNIPPFTVSRLAQLIPSDAKATIENAVCSVPELKKLYEDKEDVKNLLDTAKKLEGLPRHTSTHAAGIVICPAPVDSFVPVCISSEGTLTTQFTMTTLEELGLLKMDFLGLRTLTVIKKTLKEIRQNHCIDLTFDYQDPEVYSYIGSGQTEGIFQLESEGMKKFMRQLKPKNLEDLIAGISLYRPGPMDFIPQYIKGKSSPESISYEVPPLQEILEPTYGCIIYQEQVMQIVRKLAGYNYGRADLVRRAMSKKKAAVMEKERQVFLFGDEKEQVPGCIKNGIPESSANLIYDQMIDFAKYAFNKSHAATYAIISYQTAYLKHYFPAEFLAALMSSVKDTPAKTAEYLLMGKQLSIPIQKPDINKGSVDFTVKNGVVIYSLASIRDVGENWVRELCLEREKGVFTDFENFILRMSRHGNLNKKNIEALVKSGALDVFGHTRKFLMEKYPELINKASKEKKNGVLVQNPLLNLFLAPVQEKEEEYPASLILEHEKEVLGIYLSGHPLDEFYLQWSSGINAKSIDLKLDSENSSLLKRKKVTVGGILLSLTEKQTRKKERMAYATMEDLLGSMEIVLFPEQYAKYKDVFKEGDKIFCTGSIKENEGRDCSLLADKIVSFSDKPSCIWIQFEDFQQYESSENWLLETLSAYVGEQTVKIYLKNTKQIKCLVDYPVKLEQNLLQVLWDKLGQDNIKIN